ncbi:MAG: (2Fe-2S)-binding protein, partial [Desulfobacteraceae bacterium]|nr:(2Fe-2S)-binding protein [Desulfobacteraceae bacterium]
MTTQISFLLNGDKISHGVKDHWTLLHLLREEMGLIGTKEGCGNGECGACTVIVDNLAVNSCLYLAIEADKKKVETIEGLASKDGTLHPLQQSFVDKGGIQCGFCSPGMIMSSKALLDENPDADQEEIKHAL